MPQPLDIPETLALHKLEAAEAFTLAAQASGLPFPEICNRMRWSKSFGRRVFRSEKFYPSFADLPRWCAVVGNTIVLQWALARATTHGLEAEFARVDCQALLLRITEMFADAGTVAARTREAVGDNLLQPQELRAVVHGLDALIEGGLDLLGDLRHELKGARRGA
ncbi:hypothetical protein [uncultured Desulfovibrio sp.]|uniref:hypothetical protein n=1 Tax=uncultured Desulfovibrio sp. TaxID=167968 RepID=UPI00266B741B|nr:hypothetical protein [uncultured Desulfovibrio sp.]